MINGSVINNTFWEAPECVTGRGKSNPTVDGPKLGLQHNPIQAIRPTPADSSSVTISAFCRRKQHCTGSNSHRIAFYILREEPSRAAFLGFSHRAAFQPPGLLSPPASLSLQPDRVYKMDTPVAAHIFRARDGDRPAPPCEGKQGCAAARAGEQAAGQSSRRSGRARDGGLRLRLLLPRPPAA
jgi:hypothetical protein